MKLLLAAILSVTVICFTSCGAEDIKEIIDEAVSKESLTSENDDSSQSIKDSEITFGYKRTALFDHAKSVMKIWRR